MYHNRRVRCTYLFGFRLLTGWSPRGGWFILTDWRRLMMIIWFAFLRCPATNCPSRAMHWRGKWFINCIAFSTSTAQTKAKETKQHRSSQIDRQTSDIPNETAETMKRTNWLNNNLSELSEKKRKVILVKRQKNMPRAILSNKYRVREDYDRFGICFPCV